MTRSVGCWHTRVGCAAWGPSGNCGWRWRAGPNSHSSLKKSTGTCRPCHDPDRGMESAPGFPSGGPPTPPPPPLAARSELRDSRSPSTMLHHASPCFTMLHHASPCFTVGTPKLHRGTPCQIVRARSFEPGRSSRAERGEDTGVPLHRYGNGSPIRAPLRGPHDTPHPPPPDPRARWDPWHMMVMSRPQGGEGWYHPGPHRDLGSNFPPKSLSHSLQLAIPSLSDSADAHAWIERGSFPK